MCIRRGFQLNGQVLGYGDNKDADCVGYRIHQRLAVDARMPA